MLSEHPAILKQGIAQAKQFKVRNSNTTSAMQVFEEMRVRFDPCEVCGARCARCALTRRSEEVEAYGAFACQSTKKTPHFGEGAYFSHLSYMSL